MREIKFRAWDSVKMIYQKEDGYFDKVKHPKYSSLQCMQLYSVMQVCQVMQFTGLRDRNGRQIYEGDIVAITINKGLPSEYTGNWEIYFGSWCYMRKHPTWSSFYFDKALANNCEILGNIYENPELLNQ